MWTPNQAWKGCLESCLSWYSETTVYKNSELAWWRWRWLRKKTTSEKFQTIHVSCSTANYSLRLHREMLARYIPKTPQTPDRSLFRAGRGGEMAQQLRVLCALAEDSSLVSSTLWKATQPPVTPTPANPMPSSGLCWFLHHISLHITTYVHTQFK